MKLAVLVGVCAVLAGCGGSKQAATTSTTASTTPDANGCIDVSKPEAADRSEQQPTALLDPKKRYDVTMQTNCGSFTIRLDPKASPNAAASFASLVQHGFYDNTVFHRIAPGFVIQGGDPTATGTGGPGYSTVDTPAPGSQYTHGVVAMAKTGAEAPGTAGSQFFVVTADDAGLTPDYAIIGKIVKGLAVVDRIGMLGNEDQTPAQIVEIQRATLKVT